MDRALMAPSCTSGASTRASTTGQVGQQRQLRRGRGCLDERNLTRGRTKVHGGWGRRRREVVTSAVFDALKFDPDRVSVAFDSGSEQLEPESLLQRRYTLTHNDVTRNLTLTVGDSFNDDQTSIWYTRLLRDEVLAEWREDGLHVFVQVSTAEAWWIRWAAPLRSVVFRQKLPLVLDTLRYAERELLATYPELYDSPVYVNFSSAEGGGDKEYWGDFRTAGLEETKSSRVVCADGAGLDPRIADNVRSTITRLRRNVEVGGILLPANPAANATPPR